MNAHSHTTKSNKKSSTNFEDSDISQSFKKIAKKSGINYDIETFHKTFGFSPEAKANFSKTTIPIRKASNQNNTVSKNFEELSKLAGINYDVGVFHKAFGFTATEIASGQEKLTDSNNCEKSENESSSLKNARTVKVKIIKTPLESTEFRCEKCDKNFKSIEFMKVHFASDHDKIKTKLKCPDCDKILGDRANLRGHLAIHSGIKCNKS